MGCEGEGGCGEDCGCAGVGVVLLREDVASKEDREGETQIWAPPLVMFILGFCLSVVVRCLLHFPRPSGFPSGSIRGTIIEAHIKLELERIKDIKISHKKIKNIEDSSGRRSRDHGTKLGALTL